LGYRDAYRDETYARIIISTADHADRGELRRLKHSYACRAGKRSNLSRAEN
jgi:hypothetical protein